MWISNIVEMLSDVRTPFDGAKIALVERHEILVYLRDDKKSIPFPGCFDLPGGGRENCETPYECVGRELNEEFGISIPDKDIFWCRLYDGFRSGMLPTYFMVGHISSLQVKNIEFGSEGQLWTMMGIRDFIVHPLGVPHLQSRLADFVRDFPQYME